MQTPREQQLTLNICHLCYRPQNLCAETGSISVWRSWEAWWFLKSILANYRAPASCTSAKATGEGPPL